MHQQVQDAPDIGNKDFLLRRITTALHTSPQPDGTRILTSFAFREENDEFSMYVAAEVTHEKVLSCGHEGQEIVEVLAGEVRQLEYMIVRQPDDCDDSHVYAKARAYKANNRIKRDCKALAEFVNRRRAAARPDTCTDL